MMEEKPRILTRKGNFDLRAAHEQVRSVMRAWSDQFEETCKIVGSGSLINGLDDIAVLELGEIADAECTFDATRIIPVSVASWVARAAPTVGGRAEVDGPVGERAGLDAGTLWACLCAVAGDGRLAAVEEGPGLRVGLGWVFCEVFGPVPVWKA